MRSVMHVRGMCRTSKLKSMDAVQLWNAWIEGRSIWGSKAINDVSKKLVVFVLVVSAARARVRFTVNIGSTASDHGGQAPPPPRPGYVGLTAKLQVGMAEPM